MGGTFALEIRLQVTKHWILVVLFLWIAHAVALRAEPFERAEVTKTINIVSLLPEDKPAQPAMSLRGRWRSKPGAILGRNCSSRT